MGYDFYSINKCMARSLYERKKWVVHHYSYLYSEYVAGRISRVWYNGAGQQNWCRVFIDLRHKEKQSQHTECLVRGFLMEKQCC